MTTKNYLNVKLRYYSALNIGGPPPTKSFPPKSNAIPFSNSEHSTTVDVPFHSSPTSLQQNPFHSSFFSANSELDDLDMDFDPDDLIKSESDEPTLVGSLPIAISNFSPLSDHHISPKDEVVKFVPPHLLVDRSDTFSVYQQRRKIQANKLAY